MEKHIKALGIIFLGFGLLLIILVVTLASGVGNDSSYRSDPSGIGQLIEFLFLLFFIIIIIFFIPLLITGYGLIKMRRWSRIWGIIISSISLLNLPIGTAVGIYGLWVLTKKESKDIFDKESLKKYLIQSPEQEITDDAKELLKQSRDHLVTEAIDKKKEYDMESFDKGEDLYESENYQEAFKYFIQVAQQGYSGAQNYIGYMYLTGQGIDQDNKKAFEWYEKAATLGHAPSQYSLGYMCHQGIGVANDLVRAEFWYQKAADQGHEEANQSLKDIK